TVDASGNFVETTTPNNGSGAEYTTSKPVFFACAGPESNIPTLTKRFCSSQGNQEAIKVPGVCETLTTQTGVVEGGTCLGEDAAGVMHDCYTTTSATARPACLYDYDPNCFKQVITVYLKKPIVKCGNHVCEDDGTP